MITVQLFDYANKARGRTGPEEIVIDGVTFDQGNGICLRLDDTTRKVDIRNCTGNGIITVFKMAADGIYRVWKQAPISQGFIF